MMLNEAPHFQSVPVPMGAAPVAMQQQPATMQPAVAMPAAAPAHVQMGSA